jgi:hypothetical protein
MIQRLLIFTYTGKIGVEMIGVSEAVAGECFQPPRMRRMRTWLYQPMFIFKVTYYDTISFQSLKKKKILNKYIG